MAVVVLQLLSFHHFISRGEKVILKERLKHALKLEGYTLLLWF